MDVGKGNTSVRLVVVRMGEASVYVSVAVSKTFKYKNPLNSATLFLGVDLRESISS